jgi:cell division protein FtsN
VRRQAPDLMKGKAASITPLKATNRLLVGPFKTEDEAQSFVNKAAGKGVSAFVFKSAKGQKIDKIDGE